MKKKIIYTVLLVILIVGGYIGWQVFGPTVAARENKYFYIKTGSTYDEVKTALLEKHIIKGSFFFDRIAKQTKYNNNVKAGRYEIKSGMSIFSLVRMLRSGSQAPVKLVINKLRTKEDLAQKIAANFECDSLSVIDFLNNKDSLEKSSPPLKLTAEWQPYTIDLSDADTNSVIGAFSWVATAKGNPNGLTFYLEGICFTK